MKYKNLVNYIEKEKQQRKQGFAFVQQTMKQGHLLKK